MCTEHSPFSQRRRHHVRMHVLTRGPLDGPPVLLIHGNCSSSLYWEPLARVLPETWRIVMPDLRGYGQSETLPVDATRGLRDFADDVSAVFTDGWFAPGARPVVVGHSMGGGVAMQLLIDHPSLISALVLEAPVSPYGFGGTRDLDGTPTSPDFAGTGGGSVNPEFVRRMAAVDRSTDDPASPRNVMRGMYVADPESFGADEELMLDSMLSTAIGEDNYPGDGTSSPYWPMTGPGTRGVLNTMSPKWLSLTGIVDAPAKPPITWVRGDSDVIVSDSSFFDLAQLGKLGLVPGWPGEEDCPPQPMIGQTRRLFERYAAAGGSFREVVFERCGHSPHIERTSEFAALLNEVVTAARI